MTQTDKIGQLKLEQDHAINLLLQGKSDREVAEAVNVSRQTVNQWQNHDAVFIAELNVRRQALWGSQLERLRSLVKKAVDVLESDLESQDLRLRQSAAIHILRCVSIYGMNLKPGGTEEAFTNLMRSLAGD